MLQTSHPIHPALDIRATRQDAAEILVGTVAYPDAYNLDKNLFTDDGQKLLAASHQNCVVTLFGAVAAAGPAVTSNVTDNPGWIDALRRNNAGLKRSETPVLVIQGLKDTIVAPASSKAYAERATAVGTDVTVEWVEDAGHRELFAKKADIVARVVAGFEASGK
ncbi:alpha/beta hydrolase [Cupriavidus metallidurans]|uniref:alpha/beta hydrolase n=1 Tax=Cupriavidus metallidurans TaxID=119219 RepID=UPI001646A3FF|nr:lysophospholipase [Cupriavidus metallidurans]